jgi:hypothetical protein
MKKFVQVLFFAFWASMFLFGCGSKCVECQVRAPYTTVQKAQEYCGSDVAVESAKAAYSVLTPDSLRQYIQCN